MKRIVLSLLVFQLFQLYLGGIDFNYLRPYEGLQDSEINSIAQDKDGLMWFATWSGLISYDGFNFTHYRPELGDTFSLPTKKIKMLFVDSRGNIWIATNKHLCLFDKENEKFITFKFPRENIQPLNILHFSELEDKLIIHALDGFYFIPKDPIANKNGIARKIEIRSALPGMTYYFQHSTSVKNSIYLSSLIDSINQTLIYRAEYSDFDGKPHFFIREITRVQGSVNRMEYIEPETSLYFATTNGVFPFSLAKNQFIKRNFFSGKNIINIMYASDHRVYCTSLDPVLMYIDLHTGMTGQYSANPYRWGSLLNSNILSLFEDFSGNLWVGHQGQGISILNLYMKEFYTYRHNPSDELSLPSNTVMCMESTNESLFVGCRVGGLSVTEKNPKDLNNVKFSKVKLLNNNQLVEFNQGIWDIERINDDHLLVGSISGVYELKKQNSNWIMIPMSRDPIMQGSARKVYVDENQNVWIGIVGQGLILVPDILNNSRREFYQYEYMEEDTTTISDNEIITMFIDSNDQFWVGTTYGLNLCTSLYHNIDLSGKNKPDISFRRFIAEAPDTEYLNNNEINCIFENFDGNIWIATQGGGINIYDPIRKNFSHITSNDGLPSDDIQGILQDEAGVLWISTINGLVSFNQHTANPNFVRYSYDDGIQGSIFMVNSFYRSLDGEMFFGGDNGFTRFYPRDIKPNTIAPKLAFTDLSIYNEKVTPGEVYNKKVILENSLNKTEKIIIPFNKRVFNIGFSVLHYQHPPGNYVVYQLEGYSDSWISIPASSRYIWFSNLPFGKYTLRVYALSSDNVRSDQTKVMQIEIAPPWYREWYFTLLFIFIGVTVVSFGVYIVINRQKLAYQKKIDDISVETNESKMLFLTNIAHGLRTPLSLVIGPIEDMIQNYTDVNPRWRNHLFLVHRNSNYLLKLINQIIDFRKLHAGKLTLYKQDTDIAKLVREVVINFKGMEGRRKVNLEFELPEEPLILSIDTQKIEEVLYNLLSNAFKHTPENHTIKVTVRQVINEGREEGVRISVFNEGSKIKETERARIFERFYKTDENTEGAGIGLSFSRSLVEMHKGNLELETIEGRGVVFHVWLPVVKSELEKKNKLNVYETEKTIISDRDENEVEWDNPDIDEKQLKILLVEDNEDLRTFLKGILTRNYSCFEAGNGEEGFKLVKEMMPDIVISDIIMPVMDGYELCKMIKDNSGTCHIPVILLTAKSTNEQIKSGYDVGADAYVTKPFDINIITSQISRLIKNRELIRKKYMDQNFMIEVTHSNLSKDDEFIINIRKLLESNISHAEYNVKELASDLNISSTQLYRKVKALTGYSPVEFMRVIKLQNAYKLIMERDKSVKEVCFLSGFNNVSYFIKCFKDQFGVTPAGLRENGSSKISQKDNTKQSKIS